MAPRRNRVTDVGELLRAARGSLGFDQQELGARAFVSARQVSRWENGQRPTPAESQNIIRALAPAPEATYLALCEALGIEIEDDEIPPPHVPAIAAAPAPPPLPPPPPRPTAAELRASLDSILFASAEQRDILPRDLRAFAVELLHGVERLGITAGEAASLVAAPDRPRLASAVDVGPAAS